MQDLTSSEGIKKPLIILVLGDRRSAKRCSGPCNHLQFNEQLVNSRAEKAVSRGQLMNH